MHHVPVAQRLEGSGLNGWLHAGMTRQSDDDDRCFAIRIEREHEYKVKQAALILGIFPFIVLQGVTMTKTSRTRLVHIVAGLAVAGFHLQSIAEQAGDGSAPCKGKRAHVLSTADIGKPGTGPCNVKTGGVTLVTPPPQQTEVQYAAPMQIYVNVMPGWDGYNGNVVQPLGNRTATTGSIGVNNMPIGNGGLPHSYSRIRGSRVPTGQ